MTRASWPLFWCPSVQAQAALMQLYWDEYGCRLDIPLEPKRFHIDAMESPDELEQIMRQAPRHVRRIPNL